MGGMIASSVHTQSEIFTLKNCYSSSLVNSNSGLEVGSFIATISGNYSFEKCFYDNEVNANISSSFSQNSNQIIGLRCNELYEIVLKFNQSVWGGNNLKKGSFIFYFLFLK